MSRSVNMVLAGFGGQGVLFAGKLIAYAGLLEDREVSWLPSYGPEMRGGTANWPGGSAGSSCRAGGWRPMRSSP